MYIFIVNINVKEITHSCQTSLKIDTLSKPETWVAGVVFKESQVIGIYSTEEEIL